MGTILSMKLCGVPQTPCQRNTHIVHEHRCQRVSPNSPSTGSISSYDAFMKYLRGSSLKQLAERFTNAIVTRFETMRRSEWRMEPSLDDFVPEHMFHASA